MGRLPASPKCWHYSGVKLLEVPPGTERNGQKNQENEGEKQSGKKEERGTKVEKAWNLWSIWSNQLVALPIAKCTRILLLPPPSTTTARHGRRRLLSTYEITKEDDGHVRPESSLVLLCHGWMGAPELTRFGHTFLIQFCVWHTSVLWSTGHCSPVHCTAKRKHHFSGYIYIIYLAFDAKIRSSKISNSDQWPTYACRLYICLPIMGSLKAKGWSQAGICRMECSMFIKAAMMHGWMDH